VSPTGKISEQVNLKWGKKIEVIVVMQRTVRLRMKKWYGLGIGIVNRERKVEKVLVKTVEGKRETNGCYVFLIEFKEKDVKHLMKGEYVAWISCTFGGVNLERIWIGNFIL